MAGDGIVVLDEAGTILVFNKACETLFGWTATDAIGRCFAMLLAEDDGAPGEPAGPRGHASLPRSLVGSGREAMARHRDGACFPVELSVAVAGTRDGPQFIGIVRDLRPRRETEERLSELQRELMHLSRVSALDEMGSALAHELNQPLTAIILYLQAAGRMQAKAAEATGGGDMVGSILGKAVREAERAGRIIQTMRQFVEKRPPERQPADLNALVDEAIELSLIGQGSGVKVSRSMAANLPQVCVDGVQIQQIVVNLMRNALEAMGDIGRRRIWVETRALPGRVTLTIRDSGAGVPAAARADLFKAFATSKPSGLGLGLAISRTIAQNHGGDLGVDPGGGGRGAAFTLTLPDAAMAPASIIGQARA